MNKLTIAFIVITVVVVLVLGTLLGIRHFSPEQQEEVTQEEVIIQEPEPQATEEEVVEEEPVADFPAIVSPFGDSEEETVYPKIDITKVVEAGFKVADLLSEDFDGIIFKTIDISEYSDDDHKEFTITEADEYAGTIDELIFPDSNISTEVYSSIKSKINNSGIFEINETNQYGDNSFFANHMEQKNYVFLVVKMGERLYTLYYPAKNHNKMKNLINLL